MDLFKDNQDWYWLGRLYWNNPSSSKSRFIIDEKFNSSLFSRQKWKDENNLQASWSYQLTDNWKTAARIRSEVLSAEDRFAKFSKNMLFQEFSYLPRANITIAPAVGWASEDVYSYRDQGWYSQFLITTRQYDLGGYMNSSDGFSSVFFYPGRKIQEHRYFVAFTRQFSEQAGDSLQVGYEYVDNHYPLPPNFMEREKVIEDVEINTRYLYNNLIYRLSKRTSFQVETRLQNRDFTRSNITLHNHRRDLNYLNQVGINYRHPRLNGSFTFSTSQETNLAGRTPVGQETSRTDVDGLQAAFNLVMNWIPVSSDEVGFSFSYVKFEFSSPDTTQHIDEDRLRFLINLQYRHRFSPYFALLMNGNIYLYHQIYIHPSRSANNNWNRIYNLSGALFYNPWDFLQNNSRLEILANYTVYDFEEYLPEIISYIGRELIFTDSLKIKINDRIRLHGFYRLQKRDNGTFFQDIFSQKISLERISHFLDVGLTYHPVRGVEITPVLGWTITREWARVPQDRQVRDYFALNPGVSLLYNPHKNLQLLALLRLYRNINFPSTYYTIGRINLRYFF